MLDAGETTVQASWTADSWFLDLNYQCDYIPVPMQPVSYVDVKPKIRIFRDGQDITSTSQNANIQNVIVGQRINLSATVSGGTTSSQQWTIPEKAIDKFETLDSNDMPDNTRIPAKGRPAPIPSSKLTSNMVDFIWYDGAFNGLQKQVTFTASVNGVPRTATATFNVKRPTVTLTTIASGTTQVTNANPNSSLDLTGAAGQDTGIIIEASNLTIPPPFSGSTQFVQLINAITTRKRIVPNPVQTSTENLIGLDGCYPYLPVNSSIASDKPGGPLEGINSQGITIVYESFDYNGNWQVYYMFKPSGAGSEWVTINQLNWAWHGAAALVPNSNPYQWTVSINTPPGRPSGNSTIDTYPQWSRHIPDPRGCGF